ncbi:MAG: DUF1512 domain-containing protein [Thaumarchaeota archaeon]|nr:DUF1512 domain-containing protein [Candidatus Wolframiiraptor allenii]
MGFSGGGAGVFARMQIAGQGDLLTSLLQLIWLLFLMLFILYPNFSQRLQLSYILKDLERKLYGLKRIREEVRSRTIETLRRYSEGNMDLERELDQILLSFAITPESMDPYGIVYKLEHIVNTWEDTFEESVKRLCPRADRERMKTLTNLVEVARGIDYLYRVVRHYYLLGKKTSNIYIVLQIQMLMPQLMEIAEAYRQACYAFMQGQPVGDGVGVLAAAKLVEGLEKRTYEVAKDTIVHELVMDGRRLFVLRAAGPGGAVGKPADGIIKIIENEGERVKAIVMIDAALKLEGEDTGKVVEGIGAAIGGIGVDKFKIEEIAKKYNIPLYAFVIYESIGEAITPMRESIAKAAEEVVERVKNIIRSKVEEGASVIIAGIGNTVGIGLS